MSPLGESVAGAEAQGRIGASLGPSITARRPGGGRGRGRDWDWGLDPESP